MSFSEFLNSPNNAINDVSVDHLFSRKCCLSLSFLNYRRYGVQTLYSYTVAKWLSSYLDNVEMSVSMATNDPKNGIYEMLIVIDLRTFNSSIKHYILVHINKNALIDKKIFSAHFSN